MWIQSVRSSGLKRSTGKRIDLSPVTVIVGENESGKTEVFDAIVLALLGMHPSAGRGGTPAKTNDAILTLASGDEIETEIVLRDGEDRHTIGRRWWRSETIRGASAGSVQCSSDAWYIGPDGQRISGLRAAGAKIEEVRGPSCIWDRTDLLGASATDSDRLRLLLSSAGQISTWTPETVSAELERRGIADVVDPWDPSELPIHQWVEREWARWGAPKRGRQPGGLVSVAHTELQRSRDAAEKIQQGQVDEQAEVDPLVVQQAQEAVAAAEQRAELVAVRAQQAVDRAQQAVDRAEQAQTSRRAAEQRLATVQSQLADLRLQAGGESPRVAELEQLIDDAEDELQDGSIPDLRSKLEAAQSAVDRLRSEVETAVEVERYARGGLERAQHDERGESSAADQLRSSTEQRVTRATSRELAAFRSAELQAAPALQTLATVRQLLAEAEEQLEDEATCPTCGGTIRQTQLSALEQAAQSAAAPVESARSALSQAEAAVRGELADRQASLDAAAEQASQRLQQAELALQSAVNRTIDLRRSLRTAEQRQRAVSQDLGQANSRLDGLKVELSAARASTAEGEEATLQERERALRAEVSGIHVPDIVALRTALAQAQAQADRERQQASDELEAARSELAPLTRALTLRQQVLRLRGEVSRWEAEWREAKRVESELGSEGLMGAIVSEILEPFVDLVNTALEGLGTGRFVVRTRDERGNPICRPGLEQEGGIFVPVETLTGGQDTMIAPLILPALSRLIGGPAAIALGDKLEGISADRRAPFLAHIVGLVHSGQLDQAVYAGCPDQAPEVEGCTVITVG